jgi:phosphoglycolate phosphatase-like HAD superfamily hydrolase
MLIFDFDGVLINSIKEACLSGYNAMNKTEHKELSAMPKNVYELFITNARHFHNPYTLCSLIKWCSENNSTNPDKILTREEFKNYQQTLDIDPKEITPFFYSVRRKFMDTYPTEWANLNEPFSPIWEAVGEKDPNEIIILTAKNRAAVLKLCEFYGLKIPDENVYSGDQNKTKIDNFKSIQERFKTNQFSFIDDHLNNLNDINHAFNHDQKTIDLILCDWGYGDPQDFITAKASGFQVLGQEEVIKLI